MTSAERTEQYALRASFFAARLSEWGYTGLLDTANALIKQFGKNLQWSDQLVSPEETTIDLIESLGFEIANFYCHPQLLQSSPKMLTYYRCISAFPQKGLQIISGVSDIAKKERGASLSDTAALSITNAVNSHINILFSGTKDINRNRLEAILLATAGVTIDGSWRNQIGAEGERAVKRIILKGLEERRVLSAIALKTGDVLLPEIENRDVNIDDVLSLKCENGFTVAFSSEPDVRIVDTNGRTVAGVEVKAGLDPAAALERLGAMIKSFEELKSTTADAETLLMASCITAEVQNRLNSSKVVDRVLNLTEVLTDKRNSEMRFLNWLGGYLWSDK